MKWETINPNKTEIGGILKKLGLTIREFSAHYEIPYNTVRQWAQGTRKPPAYVVKLLNEKIEKGSKGEQLSIENIENYNRLYIIEYETIYAHEKQFCCYESEWKRNRTIKTLFTDDKLYKYIKTYEIYNHKIEIKK